AGCGKSACPVVCPVKASMFSRGQSCRGRSQNPVVWIAEGMETEPSKPIDKIFPGKITSQALLVPARNRRSKVGRITGNTGKSAEDERVAAGSVVATKRSNVRGAKGPCHLQCLQPRGRQGRDDKGVH